MAALNQLIAVRKGVQAETHGEITRLHRESTKAQLLTGLTRTYRKIDDGDADLPGETQRVQLRLDRLLADVAGQYERRWDVTAAVDWTNCAAHADITVDGQILLQDVPVSFLIFLEKQLVDLHTIVEKLPVLDPAEDWHWDGNAEAWATGKTTTVRSKKVPRNHVLAEATPQHPAQVQVWQEDIPVGYWDTIKFSGALAGQRRTGLLARVTALREAVKMAREQANMTAAVQPRPAGALLAYIFQPDRLE